jgi:GDP-mannose transporter
MLITGMNSLRYNTVPMVTVFKNVANIFTALGDKLFFGSDIDSLTAVSFGVMLAGAVAASVFSQGEPSNKSEDGGFVPSHALGIFWMLSNCLATSGYVLYMKHATKSIKLSKWGMVFYNNVLATAFLLPISYLSGEFTEMMSRTDIHTFGYFAENVMAGFVGFYLNFASLSCVSVTGPTTYAIVGSLNKIPTTVLGYFLFGAVISGQTWFFIVISLLGGFIYSYAKLKPGLKK